MANYIVTIIIIHVSVHKVLAENPQCLQQEIHALDEHQPIDSHEELEDHPSDLLEELS